MIVISGQTVTRCKTKEAITNNVQQSSTYHPACVITGKTFLKDVHHINVQFYRCAV